MNAFIVMLGSGCHVYICYVNVMLIRRNLALEIAVNESAFGFSNEVG